MGYVQLQSHRLLSSSSVLTIVVLLEPEIGIIFIKFYIFIVNFYTLSKHWS